MYKVKRKTSLRYNFKKLIIYITDYKQNFLIGLNYYGVFFYSYKHVEMAILYTIMFLQGEYYYEKLPSEEKNMEKY